MSVAAVIWAVGYVDDSSWLAVPDATAADGSFLHAEGVSPVHGLFFVGRPWQRNRASALIMGVGDDARLIVQRIAAEGYWVRQQGGDRPSRAFQALNRSRRFSGTAYPYEALEWPLRTGLYGVYGLTSLEARAEPENTKERPDQCRREQRGGDGRDFSDCYHHAGHEIESETEAGHDRSCCDHGLARLSIDHLSRRSIPDSALSTRPLHRSRAPS